MQYKLCARITERLLKIFTRKTESIVDGFGSSAMDCPGMSPLGVAVGCYAWAPCTPSDGEGFRQLQCIPVWMMGPCSCLGVQ